MTPAISALTNVYLQRPVRQRDRPLIGITSNTVPWELIRAAGFDPILLSPGPQYKPSAEVYLETVFSQRIKSIFHFLISNDSALLRAVVIPRTSEQEHKLYLYLREVVRQGVEQAPQPILYNLLHARSPEAQAYGLERTRALQFTLEQLAGHAIEPDAFSAAIAEGNAARCAMRALLQQREGPAPKLNGSEALALIGARYFMDGAEYALHAQQALQEILARPPLPGPRILIKGPPIDTPGFCAAVEAQGAIVVAEDDWWGSRAAGRDIDAGMEPIQAIFEKYYFDAPSPRVFPAVVADAWFQRNVSEVDGVIFHLPQEDDIIGWDYPRLRAFLDDRAIPHVMLREASPDEIGAFVRRLENG